jgi:hypothetical protein
MARSFCITVLLALIAIRSLAQDIASSSAEPASADVVKVILRGHVTDAGGLPVANAQVRLGTESAISDSQGNFRLQVPPGQNRISISADGYPEFSVALSISSATDMRFELQLSSAITVRAESGGPADSAQVFDSRELLRGAPGQPGVPVALPGYPSETASGGVKAPQCFASGIAGDHGEPMAQYIRVGDFLFPNNLPANAHGNGYADPNLLIPSAIGFVESDAGAFDVRHGNNAVDLAVASGWLRDWSRFFRPPLIPTITISSADSVLRIRRPERGWVSKLLVAMDFSGCLNTATSTRSMESAPMFSDITC